jgi:hypothetical protein
LGYNRENGGVFDEKDALAFAVYSGGTGTGPDPERLFLVGGTEFPGEFVLPDRGELPGD